jgi:hypothetical protein
LARADITSEYRFALAVAPILLSQKTHAFLLEKHFYKRKNWLFAGSDDGGERAAAIYTLIGSQTQQPKPGSLPTLRAGTHRRSSSQQNGKSATLERSHSFHRFDSRLNRSGEMTHDR